MEKEGFEYSKAIHERIKPLNFTAADINEVKTLSQEWKKGDFLFLQWRMFMTEYKFIRSILKRI